MPVAGDFVALTFDPQSGHEQRGHRPALVVSSTVFNRHTRLAVVCPLTSRQRGFPFHLVVPQGLAVSGFVMAEQVKSVDYLSRGARFLDRAPPEFLQDVVELVKTCLA